MQSKLLTSILLLLFFLPKNADAQQVRRFSANILAGITASQIDGDHLAGYDKPGLQAGIQVNTALGKRSEASLGFQFCQRGSKTKPKDELLFSLTLNYVEVPVLLSFKDWWVETEEGKGFYKVSFNGGASYARLTGSKLKNEFIDTEVLQDQFKNWDMSLILGATFLVKKNFGFSFRYNRSLTYIWDPRKVNPEFKQNWNGHFLSLLTQFNF